MNQHHVWMTEALTLAQQAFDLGEAPIGCLIVCDDRIISRAYNRRETGKSALAHAELLAIQSACEALGGWRLPGCTLVVTLEPCPMCAGAIVNARIPRVVFGAYDPKAGAYGGLFDLCVQGLNHTPEITGGVLSESCGALMKRFFANLRR